MALRALYRPLRPDLDGFLFAPVGDEIEGVPLSMISALTRLGLDPWEEAGRLSSLSRSEAVEQLARLIAEVPGAGRPLAEARDIAGHFIGLLPGRRRSRSPPLQVQIRPLYRGPPLSRPSRFWLICFTLAIGALISMIVHGGFPFGML
ncbi:MAG TPA: hypothetical protein VJ770_11350 [Stellaceae bacterium]|nr:hypothetical protein [Stellaceae bacterium]